MPEFKSELTEKFFGTGITGPEYITREEAKLYLKEIAKTTDKDGWVELVVQRFINPIKGWGIDSIERRLNELKHDIDLIKLRLLETAGEKPESPKEADLPNENLAAYQVAQQ
jgi:hypothetical protein